MDDFQFQVLQNGIEDIKKRLDQMNGRVSDNEQEIAVLKDRSNRAEKQGGLFGALGGGVATGIVFALKAMFDGK